MDNPVFLIGLSLLLIHEMDAVRAREWRVLIGLNRLNDERSFSVFTGLHIPLYVLLFWGYLTALQCSYGLRLIPPQPGQHRLRLHIA